MALAALAPPQKVVPPVREPNLDVVDALPFDASLNPQKRDSTGIGFEGVKRAPNVQPGLGDYTEFARPSDDAEKAAYQQR